MTPQRISVNGVLADLPTDSRLNAVVATVTSATAGIAVAVNGEVVPRSTWSGVAIKAGDAVEILTAVQGG